MKSNKWIAISREVNPHEIYFSDNRFQSGKFSHINLKYEIVEKRKNSDGTYEYRNRSENGPPLYFNECEKSSIMSAFFDLAGILLWESYRHNKTKLKYREFDNDK